VGGAEQGSRLYLGYINSSRKAISHQLERRTVILIRMLLAECFIVSIAGAALGVLIALWGVDAIPRLVETQIPFWIVFVVDWPVVVFAGLLAILTALAVGLVPALRSSRADLVDSLRDGAQSATTSARRGRLRSALVIAQIAGALVLLAGAGLMIKTFRRAQNMGDLAHDPHSLLTANVQANVQMLQPRYDDAAQIGAFAASVEARVRSVPGVIVATVEHNEFLGTFVGAHGNVALEGATTPVVFVGVSVLLAVVSIAACYAPARNAVRVAPVLALRYE
jgi:ABC-type antimicrobial peptide transport system permease subunit